jgi:hypothetical protein
MNKVIEYAPAVAIAFVGIGLTGYAIALILAAFFSRAVGNRGAQLATWFTSAPAPNIGLPSAAISAFAITEVLLRAFLPSTDSSGQVQFKAFGLEFSGPSGPITIWLICFLGFVIALKLLRS